MLDALLIVAGYLAGSVSAAIIVCKAMGLPDPRAGGSGNPGATNVLRLGGKKAAVLTLAADVAKGVLPVAAAHAFGEHPATAVLTALAAFLGHLYPVFFRFQGGKGVATAFGALTTLAWPVGLSLAATWLAVAIASRYSSMSSITAALLAPLYAAWWGYPPVYVVGIGAISALVLWRHRSNIGRLIAGEESRINLSR